jgi:hypothetical protein
MSIGSGEVCLEFRHRFAAVAPSSLQILEVLHVLRGHHKRRCTPVPGDDHRLTLHGIQQLSKLVLGFN